MSEESKMYYHLARQVDETEIGQEKETAKGLSRYWQGVISSTENNVVYQFRKEYIVEEIRKSEFPDLPSRKRSLFMIDTQWKENAELFLRGMGFRDSNLYGRTLTIVEPLQGNSHFADMEKLNVEDLDCSVIEDAAREYWNGMESHIPMYEILFEGSYIIRDIVKIYQ